ncbi:hypothetical protein BDV96DRAFT_591867 [Lophiotrema nucula]|uniref:Uncharacterized protein n=1 Tax=Lophiotrema nucula TaxID=690887 RepID=A0A6A5YHH3_9PLEO|nr:hypothetical protein BDV96DRAFT_591867 [Lophiotrema nucula]
MAAEIKKPARYKIQKPGMLYLMKDTLSGLKKSGTTMRATAGLRMREISSRCGLDLELIMTTDATVFFPRAEVLVQTFFHNLRRHYYCNRDGTKHQEWFDIPDDLVKLASHVLKLCVRFLQAKPYDKHGHLKPECRSLVRKMLRRSSADKSSDHKAHERRLTKFVRAVEALRRSSSPASASQKLKACTHKCSTSEKSPSVPKWKDIYYEALPRQRRIWNGNKSIRVERICPKGGRPQRLIANGSGSTTHSLTGLPRTHLNRT